MTQTHNFDFQKLENYTNSKLKEHIDTDSKSVNKIKRNSLLKKKQYIYEKIDFTEVQFRDWSNANKGYKRAEKSPEPLSIQSLFSQYNFHIDIYQRNFAWTPKRSIDSMYTILNNFKLGYASHLGNLKGEELMCNDINTLNLVDAQQRTTNITLTLCILFRNLSSVLEILDNLSEGKHKESLKGIKNDIDTKKSIIKGLLKEGNIISYSKAKRGNVDAIKKIYKVSTLHNRDLTDLYVVSAIPHNIINLFNESMFKKRDVFPEFIDFYNGLDEPVKKTLVNFKNDLENYYRHPSYYNMLDSLIAIDDVIKFQFDLNDPKNIIKFTGFVHYFLNYVIINVVALENHYIPQLDFENTNRNTEPLSNITYINNIFNSKSENSDLNNLIAERFVNFETYCKIIGTTSSSTSPEELIAGYYIATNSNRFNNFSDRKNIVENYRQIIINDKDADKYSTELESVGKFIFDNITGANGKEMYQIIKTCRMFTGGASQLHHYVSSSLHSSEDKKFNRDMLKLCEIIAFLSSLINNNAHSSHKIKGKAFIDLAQAILSDDFETLKSTISDILTGVDFGGQIKGIPNIFQKMELKDDESKKLLLGKNGIDLRNYTMVHDGVLKYILAIIEMNLRNEAGLTDISLYDLLSEDYTLVRLTKDPVSLIRESKWDIGNLTLCHVDIEGKLGYEYDIRLKLLTDSKKSKVLLINKLLREVSDVSGDYTKMYSPISKMTQATITQRGLDLKEMLKEIHKRWDWDKNLIIYKTSAKSSSTKKKAEKNVRK